MRRSGLWCVVAMLGLAPLADAQPTPAAALRIEGSFARPSGVDMAAIERCAPVDVDVKVRADAGQPVATRRYTGCRLRDLIRQAEPVEARPRELRRSYLVATAGDGYQVVFSWAELFVTPLGDAVIVAHRRDGRPLPEGEGPLAIVSGMDTGAARHVKDVRSVALRPAGP